MINGTSAVIGISAFKYPEKTDSIINFQAILQENYTYYTLIHREVIENCD